MEILLRRKTFTEKSTIGDLFINDKFYCNTLEDANRERFGMPVLSWKIKGLTCIPCGRYLVEETYSPRFKKFMLQIMGVPGFVGVRIHRGNKPEDTDGCPLLGFDGPAADWVSYSTKAYDLAVPPILKALKAGEKVFITIENNNQKVRVF